MQTNIREAEARPRTRKWHMQTINQSWKQCESVENLNADKIMRATERKKKFNQTEKIQQI